MVRDIGRLVVDQCITEGLLIRHVQFALKPCLLASGSIDKAQVLPGF